MNLSAVFIIVALNNYRKLRIITLLSSLALIITVSLIFPITKQRVIYQTLDQMGITDDKKIVIFSHQHNELYKTAINMFRDNIYIGVGVKNFRNQCMSKMNNPGECVPGLVKSKPWIWGRN